MVFQARDWADPPRRVSVPDEGAGFVTMDSGLLGDGGVLLLGPAGDPLAQLRSKSSPRHLFSGYSSRPVAA
jgi:hypothetical protein